MAWLPPETVHDAAEETDLDVSAGLVGNRLPEPCLAAIFLPDTLDVGIMRWRAAEVVDVGREHLDPAKVASSVLVT